MSSEAAAVGTAPVRGRLELRGIVKRFPGGVIANDGIDLEVDAGEIRALLGENGAGKSTLMRVLYGLETPDEGEIHLDGRRLHLGSPDDAIAAGLGMVHQHFMLFPSLTVTENVIFGAEPATRGLVDFHEAHGRVSEISTRYGLEVEPRATVGSLPLGVRQRVEILRLLYRGARILILDEPTTVLTPTEHRSLFTVLERLAGEGKSVLFITHKLEEVMALADTATVLRRGRVTAETAIADTSARDLGRMMVGRETAPVRSNSARLGSKPVLTVDGLHVTDNQGRVVVRDVDFEVRSREIVGILGVAGNGQAEMMAALAGLRPATSGRIVLGDMDVSHASVAERRKAGLAYIPEDRNGVGLALEASVADNLSMGFFDRPELRRRGLPAWDAIAERARDLIDRFRIKGRSETPAAALSGGHRQRLVVARELDHRADLLIAEYPTQGIDVGAGERVLRWLAAARDEGTAVLWVSSELSELLSLADRILVMFEGRLVADRPAVDLDEETLGLLMGGG